jgi:hypothetical protein
VRNHLANLDQVIAFDTKAAEYLSAAGISRSTLGSCKIKPLPWAVKGLIPTDGITVLYGASGSGKTFLAAHLALCVASGSDFLRHKVKKKGAVVYIAAESPNSLERRLAVMSQLNKIGYSNFKFKGDEISIFKGNIDLFNHPDNVIGAIELFHDALDDVGLCIIDTLSAAFAGLDENSGDMAIVVKQAEYIQRKLLCPVVIIHHTGKDVGRGLRGHSSLRGNIEQALYVEGLANPRLIKVDKIKDEKIGDETTFDLISIDTGILDDDGSPVMGCLVQVAAFDAIVKRSDSKKGKLSDNGANALKAYDEAYRNIQHPNKIVSRELFDCYLQKYFKDIDSKHRKQAIGRALLNAVAKNYLTCNDRGEYFYA